MAAAFFSVDQRAFLGAPEGVELPEDEGDDEPHAARIAPNSGADIPSMLPRRRNSLRPMWPATSSSM